jgi:hypothetical protein
MPTDTCVECGNPIYYGPRTDRTFRPNDPSSREKIWRHVDTEHRKCAGRYKAWPVSNQRVQ